MDYAEKRWHDYLYQSIPTNGVCHLPFDYDDEYQDFDLGRLISSREKIYTHVNKYNAIDEFSIWLNK